MQTFFRQIAAAAANGYILMYTSEHVFWAHVRPEDTLKDWLIGWVVYSLAGYVVLALIRAARIRTVWALYLAAAVFGWLVEGVFVQTTYDDLPLSISWTGLAWHALLSVGVGWFGFRAALKQSFGATARLATLAGTFYGLWAIALWAEPGGRPTPLLAFAGFVWTTTALFTFAHGVFEWAAPALQRPSRVAMVIVALIFALYFAFVAVLVAPIALVALPLILGLAALGLWGHRRQDRVALALFSTEPIRPGRYLGLAMLPLAATAFYAVAEVLGLRWHTNWVVYLVTTPLGFAAFGYALFKSWRRGAGPATAARAVKEML